MDDDDAPMPIRGRAVQECVGSDLTARLMVGEGSLGVVFGDAVAWRTPARTTES